MTSQRPLAAIAAHFRDKAPNVAATYAALLTAARKLGPVQEDPKKTSIHLVRESAFAGVATQKAALVLTLKSASAVQSPRIRRSEQASANRWHLELKLAQPAEVDAELLGWLAAAYELAGD